MTMNLYILKTGLGQRAICVVLAASMALAPEMNVLAQNPGAGGPVAGAVQDKVQSQPGAASVGPAAKIDTTYVTPGAVALIVFRPGQLMKSPVGQMLPVEVATAAGLKYLGIDPANVDEVCAFAELSNPTMPSYGLTFKFIQPLAGFSLPQDLKAHTQLDQMNGRRYLKSQQPMLPSFYAPDKQTLLVAPDATLKQLLKTPAAAKTGPFLDRVSKVAGGNDLYMAVDLATLRPFKKMGLAQAQQTGGLPPDIAPLVDAVKLISSAELTLNISKAAPSSLVVHANDEASAEKVMSLITDASAMYRVKMKAQFAQLAASDDPVERAFAQYTERMSDHWAKPLMPTRDGASLTFFHIEGSNSPQQLLVVWVMVGVLVSLGLPATQAARHAARQNVSINNMKQISIALQNYHDTRKTFPAHAIYSKDGKPLLSWRVAILPFIEEQQLYAQFHLDEPWDSEHNRALIPLLPQVYANPNMKLEAGKTAYLGVYGKECVFDGTQKGTSLQNIKDGSSNTIAIVEADADKAVEWTKPADWEFDAKNPSNGLGKNRPNWLAAFCDGSVQTFNNTIDPSVLKAFFTKAGGEPVRRP
jgi:hypothetical protein